VDPSNPFAGETATGADARFLIMRRRGATTRHSSAAGTECLKALWGSAKARFRDVREVLVGNKNLAYTTGYDGARRLEKRGGVSRKKLGLSFTYVPEVSQDALRRFA